ncbi:MAG: AMP-binding protein [Armatimonadota bacterium]|nr:AMP-binding protein [Armatimonadota bacterium]
MAATAHADTFVRDNLPPPDAWPPLVFDLPELRYPDRLNCTVELLDRGARRHPERPCIRAPGVVWTYGQLLEHSNRIAHVLVRDMGLVPGNRVLLRSANTPMLVAAWFAVLRAGGVVVATMPLLRARELVPIIEKARISHALADARLSAELEDARAAAPVLRRIAYWGEGGELERLAATHPADFDPVNTSSDDPALVAFTSGTTGEPKGCVHFHRDVLAICDTFAAHVLRADPDDLFAGSPPLAFTYGLGGLVAFPMRIGASSLLLERASPDLLLAAVAEFGVRVLFTSPTAYRALAALWRQHRPRHLYKCVSAGEPLPASTRNQWKEVSGVEIIDGIGSTEMLHIFVSHREEEARPGAIGRAVPGYQARLLDERGDVLPPGRVGRLAVRGPTGCRYLADARQRQYVQHGWNVTGDACLLDEDGYFHFQARTDDLIISAGYNIAPPEVEDTLLEHPAVAECGVAGVPDPERGQVVKAYVVLRADFEPSEDLRQELQGFVKRRIAPYKYPRAIEFCSELPRTLTGKLQRHVLREREAGEVRP